MKFNNEIEEQHKLLNSVLEEMIIADLDKIADMYFKKYQPVMEEMQSIVDEVYSYAKLTENEYDKYIYRFVELGFTNKGDNRVDEINMIINGVNKQYRKTYTSVIKEYIVKPLAQIGIDAKRIAKECQRAEFRLTKQLDRLKKIQVEEMDREFISVVFYVKDALLDYSKAGRVIWNEEKVEEQIIEEVQNFTKIKTDDIKFIIDMAIDNGYTKVRQNGSHSIWKHENGQIVVIPLHNTIDVYLGMAIQKQIIERSK